MDKFILKEDKANDIAFIRDQITDRKMCIKDLDKTRTDYSKQKEKRDLERVTNRLPFILVGQDSVLNTSNSSDTLSSSGSEYQPSPAKKQNTSNSQSQQIDVRKDTMHNTMRTALGANISANKITAALTKLVIEGGGNPDKVPLSYSSVYRMKNKILDEDFEKLKKLLEYHFNHKDGKLELHFDGKIIKDLIPEHCDKAKDRIFVLVSFNGKSYLLGAPGIESGTGLNQFNAISELLKEMDIADNVHSLCFDTTSSNTGKMRGAYR